jgi:hypothetical protein
VSSFGVPAAVAGGSRAVARAGQVAVLSTGGQLGHLTSVAWAPVKHTRPPTHARAETAAARSSQCQGLPRACRRILTLRHRLSLSRSAVLSPLGRAHSRDLLWRRDDSAVGRPHVEVPG